MRTQTFLPGVAAGLALMLALVASNSRSLAQEDPAALKGQVRSTAEGLMEGVVVSAKKTGSTVTVSVLSDARGEYSFPRNRLATGQYSLSIRAVGYEMDDPGAVEISSSKTVTSNLTLRNAKDLSSQLTCVVCHTLERIVKSRHDAAEFVAVLERMATYTNSSFPLHVQKRPARWLMAPRGETLRQSQQRFAQFLSTINLSSASTWAYPLETFPRPKGKDTQIIITEYDLPRSVIEPHDVIVDSQGIIWYFHRFRTGPDRKARREDREDYLLPDPDTELAAAPRLDGRRGPLLVCRVPCQSGCRVRHAQRTLPGMAGAHAMERALRCRRGQERGPLDWISNE